MAMYKNQLNGMIAKQALLHSTNIKNKPAASKSQLLKIINKCTFGYGFLKSCPSQPPISIIQAMPRCTINPPQILPVLKLTIPRIIPPKKLLMASPIGLPR
jgi:hypothetical protein